MFYNYVLSLYVLYMPAGRKKKDRNVCIDFESMICNCFGPLGVNKPVLKTREQFTIQPDELQTIVYQDIDGLTMAEWAKKMWISKTVYAMMYQKARTIIAQVLIKNAVLHIECPCTIESDNK